MIYIKKLKKNEKIKMQAVEILPEGKRIMLPHIVLGNFCLMPMAKKIVWDQRPDPVRMADLLIRWYRRTTNAYSEGIYSFARQGRTRKSLDMPYYRYIKQEIDDLLLHTDVKPEYLEIEKLACQMWEQGYETYKDTFFWSYNFLHGDMHSGNIVSFKGQYRLIDWENFRTGPKEIELAFYFCWDYLRWEHYERNLQDMLDEIQVFYEKNLISSCEKERILYLLIPMWMLLLVVYLNNGNLRFAEERKKVCEKIIPLYKQQIYDHRRQEERFYNE